MMSLIPGLPDDIGRECLLRVPHRCFPHLRLVCRSWKREVESPFFHHLGKSGGLALILEMAPKRRGLRDSSLNEIESRKKHSTFFPIYPIMVPDPETGKSSPVPKIPGLSRGLPLFCRVVFVGEKIVVLGGFDAAAMTVSNAVYVYDRNAGSWRCGRPLPGPRRLFFSCAAQAATGQVVFGGGRSAEDEQALRCFYVYDVDKDFWAQLSDSFVRKVLGGEINT